MIGVLQSRNGTTRELLVRRKFWQRARVIIDKQSGKEVARFQRKRLHLRELVGKQTYEVDVHPRVDIGIISALCVCYDEMMEMGKTR
jgi:hypothetical protein